MPLIRPQGATAVLPGRPLETGATLRVHAVIDSASGELAQLALTSAVRAFDSHPKLEVTASTLDADMRGAWINLRVTSNPFPLAIIAISLLVGAASTGAGYFAVDQVIDQAGEAVSDVAASPLGGLSIGLGLAIPVGVGVGLWLLLR